MKIKNEKVQKACSSEHLKYLKEKRKEALKIRIFQIAILAFFIIFWELLAQFKLIDSFIMSSPSRVFKTFLSLQSSGQLWSNVLITVFETVVGFLLGTFLGILIATLIWWSGFIFKVSEPYLVVLNALPKVALGPIIIVWLGAGMGSIILMALLVSVILSVMNVLHGFMSTDKNQISLMKSFGANKFQIFTKLVLPSNISVIISTLKINVGMSLIGVITGEFLVSEAGIGYLIVYGGQVFKMDLVMVGIIVLAALAWVMYALVQKFSEVFLKGRR